MFDNYFKVALRNLVKQKVYSIINISGLAIGIACSILIMVYIQYELSYDKFHEKTDQIYRVGVKETYGDVKDIGVSTTTPLAEALVNDYPEVEQAARVAVWGKGLVNYKDKFFNEYNVLSVDSTFFDVFTFPLIKGNPKTALVQPYTAVITKSTAEKYFDNENPVNKILKINNKGFKITGVVEDVPDTSHLTFDLLLSLETFEWSKSQQWMNTVVLTYIVLKKGFSPDKLEAKFPALIRKYIPEVGKVSFNEWLAAGNNLEYFLQPLTDIHLNPNLSSQIEKNGNAVYVYIFLMVAIFILLIACINFINLITARSANRSKEIGIRKVVGAHRPQLIRQFLTESIIMSIIALGIAIILVELFLPYFRDLVQKPLKIHYFDSWWAVPGLIVLGVVVGLLSGAYSAVFLSSFHPISVLKGKIREGVKSSSLRNALVVFQFTISVILIIAAVIISNQMEYIQNRELGFQKDHVVIIEQPQVLGKQSQAFKETLAKHSSIQRASGTLTMPGKSFSTMSFTPEGMESKLLDLYFCDYNFLKTLQMKMAEGRFFARELPSDKTAIIINEAAVEMLGWEKPLGKRIQFGDEYHHTVIGVIKNFHYESLHKKIRPMAMMLLADLYYWTENYILVLIQEGNVNGTLDVIRRTWNTFAPDIPLEYSFLDDDYDRIYINEKQTQKIITIFSIIAIFIALLGLFGVVSYICEKRTKEIAIRKTMGASTADIALLLSKDFIKWIILGNIAAWPIAYYVMRNWLNDFAYRTPISVIAFLFAAGVVVVFALFTTAFEVFKAAKEKPVNALSNE